MAQEEGAFDFADVVASLNEKLIRRHPHVFGDAKGLTPREVEGLWERIKTQERMQKPKRETGEGALAGVPVALPALTRALKLQVKAGRVGFDWNDAHAVLDKIREEISETEAELARQDTAAAGGEIGDLLFAVVNLARHIGVDAEAALRGTNQKFERRFAAMEGSLAQSGRRPDQATLAEMEDLWQEAKRREGAISTRDPE
jgi:ATP diphosphatase